MRELHVRIVPSATHLPLLSIRPAFGDSLRQAITETFEDGERAVLVSAEELEDLKDRLKALEETRAA